MATASTRFRPPRLSPLLRQYRAAPPITPPPTPALTAEFPDGQDEGLIPLLRGVAEAALPVCFHASVFTHRLRTTRFSLGHLFRGQDPLPERLGRCVTPGETYHVPGLGAGFWSALVRVLDPGQIPPWCPAIERGLARLGLFPESARTPAERFAAALAGWARLGEETGLGTVERADFLERVSRLTGRELPATPGHAAAFAWTVDAEQIRHALREVRTRVPLRKRLRETPPEVLDAVREFQSRSAAGEHEPAFAAFRRAFPDGVWEAALPRLDDAYSASLSLPDRARLWSEVAAVLREQFRVHPLELADVVTAAGREAPPPEPGDFGGFCSDTFAFLGELTGTNSRDWMAANRDRYQFVLREPLVELCRALADRYVRPVLNREYGWDLECDARAGRALTSICKNDFGRGGPYQPVQWVTFYRRCRANKRADAQFFVRVAADGVRYGFHLGRTARDAGGQFRKAIQEQGEAVFRALMPAEVLGGVRFWVGDDLATEVRVKSAADLRAWAANKTIAAGVHRGQDAAGLRAEELPNEIFLTFDRLLPLFACAAEADPRPVLTRRAGNPDAPAPYDPASFHRETFLPEVWLDRVLGLLRLKKQLVLQGVPGTGKTHVARSLARLLTHDVPGCTRLVQFHPAYSYEEFVEGIRVRNVEIDGRNEVTYPVEDGVLCEFAAEAAARPGEPHVLVVDELNRGNLPRIFGELLFLLEYREQAVTLPYSKRPFRLPDNLFVLATMNPLDRSAVALDQALRRRFSFVDMPADAAILAKWLEDNPPAEGSDDTFGPRVVRLFEELNRRLARERGPEQQIGHSFFMVPDIDAEKLGAVWDHHVRPMLLDYLGGREDRLRDYDPAKLLGSRRKTEQPT